jgi:hypothetical protein
MLEPFQKYLKFGRGDYLYYEHIFKVAFSRTIHPRLCKITLAIDSSKFDIHPKNILRSK